MAVMLKNSVYHEVKTLMEQNIQSVDEAQHKAQQLGLLAAAVWIDENQNDFIEGLKNGFEIDENESEEEGITTDSDELLQTPTKKRHWTKRQLPIPIEQFMETVVRPIMGQVAANKIKKNLGMVAGALAARCSVFPTSEYRAACKTNPLQTFSADLNRFRMHPNYNGTETGESQTVMPELNIALEDCEIPVYPTMSPEYGMTPVIIDRFVSLCEKHGIDHTMFTTTGGSIKLTPDYLRVCAYFASDKGLPQEQKLWGEMTVITHFPANLLDEQDKPQGKQPTGRKRGRPRKTPQVATIAQTETTEEPVAV
jgi:hypothetical protein